jgi:hypothetical protein
MDKDIDLDRFQTLCRDAWEASSCGLTLTEWYEMPEDIRKQVLEDCDDGLGKKPSWLSDLLAHLRKKEK